MSDSGDTAVIPDAHVMSARLNGVRIAHQVCGGSGPPLVLVHGSWGSHHSWDPAVPTLAEHARLVTYDRRGHSSSERPQGQGRFTEDVDDLAALIEHLGATDQSPPFYRPILDRLADLLPQAERHVYPGAGRIPYATHPDDFAREVLAFVSERRGGTA